MTREEAKSYILECLDHEEATEIIKALEQEPCEDCISRQAVLDTTICKGISCNECSFNKIDGESGCLLHYRISKLPSVSPVRPTGKWIPVSERLPKDLEPVNITWINHNLESYYKDIKDKPFTATGVYFNGQWYWWSTLCTDILAEYSHNYSDIIDEAIEIIAWMPLPEPYKAESEDKE